MASSFSSPWPDPNSSVLSKIDFGVPLVELFKWLDVRDTLLGENYKVQDIAAALALARDCEHPDAVWLTSIFEGKDVSTRKEAGKVLLLHKNDARALCFFTLTDNRENAFHSLRRSAEMGNAFACSTLCGQVWCEEEAFAASLAQRAAFQLERDGCFWLGRCHRDAFRCERNLNLAKENFLIAAELGQIWAAEAYARLLGELDPWCWVWWSRAAVCGLSDSFRSSFSKQVEQFFSGSGNASIVFLIGRALKRNMDMEKMEIFGSDDVFDALLDPANQAVSFYDLQNKYVRLAVDTWALIAIRLNLVKDVRIYIGKLIWEERFAANYTAFVQEARHKCSIQ